MAKPIAGEIIDNYRFKGGDPNSQDSWEEVSGAPIKGDILDGYRFKGGNPNDEKSWEPVVAEAEVKSSQDQTKEQPKKPEGKPFANGFFGNDPRLSGFFTSRDKQSVVAGKDGQEVAPNPEASKTFNRVIADNKQANQLKPGAKIVDGVGGILELGAKRGYAGIGKIEAGLAKAAADIAGSVGLDAASDYLNESSEQKAARAKEIEEGTVLRGTPVKGFAKESIVQDLPEAGANAVSSIIQTAPAILGGAVSGGSTLPIIFATSGAQEYLQGREAGLSPDKALARAIPMAAFEVIGEKIGGADKLADALRKAATGNGAADLGIAMLASSLREQPGEQITTAGQFLVDKDVGIGLNQDATFDDYIKAAKDTALATLLQGGAMTVGGSIITAVAKQAQDERARDNILNAGTGDSAVADVDAAIQAAESAVTGESDVSLPNTPTGILAGSMPQRGVIPEGSGLNPDDGRGNGTVPGANDLGNEGNGLGVSEAVSLGNGILQSPADLGQFDNVDDAALNDLVLNESDPAEDVTATAAPETATAAVPSLAEQAAPAVQDAQESITSPVSSWIVRNKETGETIMETAQKSVADKVNTDKYEVVPAQQHLAELSDPNSKVGKYAREQADKSPEKSPTVKPKSTKPKKPKESNKPTTLRTRLINLGGINNKYRRDVARETGVLRNGYNFIFKNDSNFTLEDHIQDGSLDDYLPYNLRSDVIDDPTEARDYLADRIANGEEVLPYDIEEEARLAKAYDNFNLQDDLSIIDEDANLDEINRLLSEAGYDEREESAEQAIYESAGSDSATENTKPESTDSGAAGNQRAQNEQGERGQSADVADDFDLNGQTNAEIEAEIQAQVQRNKEAAKQEEADKQARIQNEIRARSQVAADSFSLEPTAKTAEETKANDKRVADAQIMGQNDMFGEGNQVGDANKMVDDKPSTGDNRFASNKVFTADKVEAARARLKSKLGTLNSGIDPELLIDGMTIAGAYIESGVRKFSDYAKAMTEDFGDSIKPYLLSFYEAARAYPGIDKAGMTDVEAAAKEHQALLTPAILEEAKDVVGNGVVESPKSRAKPNGEATLTQDWGVDHISGYTESDKYPDDNTSENAQSGLKMAFLAEAKKYLTQVAKLLEAEGYTPHTDRRGRTEKPVSVNEGGIAVSGDVTLTMRKGNVGVYVDIGTSAIRGLTGNHPQAVSVLIRATDDAENDKFATKSGNNWLRTNLSATELANKLMQTAERYVNNTQQAERGNQNARPTQTEQIQPGRTQGNLLTEQPRDSAGQSVDAGVGRSSESANAGGDLQAGVSEASGNRTTSAGRSNRDESSSGSREASNAGNTGSASNDLNDFEITNDTGIGEGSLAQKYNDNITAIKLIKTLEAEGRQATPEERNQLAKYNGFGALSKVFEPGNAKYKELKELLTDEEYNAARASILNAYFTSPAIVKSMYDAVSQLGFKGGRVLEPSLGSGNFFGMMPAGMRNKSQLNGVELDIITSRLAKFIYPNANIAVATGFQQYDAPQGYFDLVISNPPFGSETLVDAKKADYSGFSIHNFFIAKSIDKLRENGIMAVVVSHSFMDAMDSRARQWISKRANLLGGVRLPNTAFKDNAGTEVITDILFFQKTSKPQSSPEWLDVTDNGDYTFNNYFIANPRNVLGRVEDTTSQFGKTFTVEPLAGNGTLAQQLKEFVSRLPQNVYVEPESRIEVLDSADNTVPDSVKVGTYYIDASGAVRQRMPDTLGSKRSVAWESPNAKAQARMVAMMNLRDLLRSQMRLERDPMASEKDIEGNRTKLNREYDKFLSEYGYLNSTTNRRLFMDDTESALLQALEIDYDQGVTAAKSLATGIEQKPASAQKADIFNRRVLFPPSDSIIVNNAKDALLSSLDVKGRVDVDYMAEVYKKPVAEIVSELGDVIYNDPVKGYVTADEYLSGDVKTKLAEAEAKAGTDSAFARNVEALKKVIPTDKLPSEIYAAPGANWIPADVYSEFTEVITGIAKNRSEYKYVSATAVWLGEKTSNGDAGKMVSDFGTEDVNAFDLFNMLINGKAPEVKETQWVNGERKSVINIEKTEAARSKLEKIKESWHSWIFSDAERADRLATIYNEKHNRIVKRVFDGSHMQFYGMSPAVTLRPSQKNVVWRAIQDRNVLLDHVVGAGKTMAMASIAMEMKRLGIARKPLFVVPNHLTLQWRSEFTKLYPASNILAATPEDFTKDKRERMFAKMVTGTYDAIIIGHSSLKKVGLPADVESKMYEEQIKELTDAIEAAKKDRGDRGITRDMEKIKQNLQSKIDKLKLKAGEKDNVVSFDELGVDAMFVDEMHEFKNLFFTTQMQRTAGLGNPAGSGKALDMFMKVRYMTQRFGENVPLITATGTPVSNSLAEMFTMQRYMKYPEMKRQGLHLFDAWAKQYGEVENVYEVAPSGVGYRQSTRFSKFKNLPSLLGNYTQFADIVTMQDLKDQATQQGKIFPVPKIKSGKPINVIAQRSELQRDFFGVPQLKTNEETGEIEFELNPAEAGIGRMDNGKYRLSFTNGFEDFDTFEEAELELVTKSLTPRTYIDPKSLLGQFANLQQLTRETKGKINALSLTGLANKAGLDYRIINPSAPDYANSKINLAVNNMVQLWKDTTKDKGTQIVFCDMSVPLSARANAASKERYALVRGRNGELIHKKATLHTVSDMEGFPFYLVESGSRDSKSIAVYEPVSGVLINDGFSDKKSAKDFMQDLLSTDNGRNKIFGMRDTNEGITKDDIDEYFAEQEKIEIADDNSNLITPEDLEAIAGSSSFSVYDDIKEKLIKNGVPDNQIAFIHDFNTPKQKEDLFKRVKRGEVRFLFGSTPKLGAGTNVQDRLVGLHHIDAPWRPSDLEQREGRIIRQGNKLAFRPDGTPIEGFEVAIYRYATEQTYDTRRWQLLEHKAAGIEQLRKYTGEAEIEDVATEASNSADMKAAASGNPLILEETKLRTEVKRLQNLEKAHADSKFSMGRKIKQNENAINQYLPEKIKGYEGLMADAKANPVPNDKDKVAPINVDGQKTTSKEIAEKALLEASNKVRNSLNSGESKSITYRGIKFTISRGFFLGQLRLDSPDGMMHAYGEKEGFSPSGVITRFNNYIDSFDAKIKQAEAAIAFAENENNQLRPRLNEPFEDAALLKQTQARHADVQRKLMKSSQLEAVPEAQRPEFDRVIAERKAQLKQLGYEKSLQESEADDTPMFKRRSIFEIIANMPEEKQKAARKVQQVVDQVSQGWVNRPEIIVAFDMEDERIPESVRKYNQEQVDAGAKGVPAGFIFRDKVYIIASEIKSPQNLIEALFHEALGHYGLRNYFGSEQLNKVLDQVAALMPKQMKAKAKQYGQNLATEKGRRVTAEEVLAELAQTKPNLTLVQKAIAAIRTWLRDNIPFLSGMQFTNEEIINNFILPARKFVERGGNPEEIGSRDPAMIRSMQDTIPRYVDSINRKEWWRTALPDKKAIKDRGIFFASRYKDAEFYGRPIDKPFKVSVVNPLIGDEKTIMKTLGIDAVSDDISIQDRFELDAKMKTEAEKRGYDSIVLMSQRAFDGFNKTGRLPTSLELNVFNYQNAIQDTITVDGIERSTLNSNGKPIHPTREGIENFWRWFGDSKVVDWQGRPKPLYHGSWKSGFDKFYTGNVGAFFTDNEYMAATYSGSTDLIGVDEDASFGVDPKQKQRANYEVYLKIENPYTEDFEGENWSYNGGSTDSKAVNAKRDGHDGAIFENVADKGWTAPAFSDEDTSTVYVVFDTKQVKSSTNNTGSFDSNKDSILFMRQNPLFQTWNGLEESGFLTDLVYKFQDKYKDLKDVTNAIKRTGANIADNINAYLQEELYHGRVAKRVQDFTRDELEPLLNAMNEAGVTMPDFEHYLWARHAPERNAQIALINPGMPDGGSGLTNQEAKTFMDNIAPDQKAKFESLAAMVDGINKRSLDILVKYGIEDMSLPQTLGDTYQYYVPLMREEMDKGGSGAGQGFSVKGNSTKRAMGSQKAVVDIIANIAAQREKFIVRGEKNRVAKALVGLAKLNPNDDFWKVDKPPVIRYINKATGMVEEMVDPSYKSRDNVVVARFMGKDGRVQERAVVFNEYDKRAMRMAEAMKNLDMDGLEEWIGTVAKFTRYFASVNTQYNPLFGIVNGVRDIQSAALNISSTELAGSRKELAKNIGKAWLGIYSDLRANRKGQRTNSNWATLWEEYQLEGGQTGYRELFRTTADRAEELQKIVNPDWWKSKGWGKVVSLNSETIANAEALAVDKVGKPIFQWLDDYNASIENATRLAAYKVALDKGMSKQQAASIAKNLTVNFNRKGATRWPGAFYAFFNASVQGTARIKDTTYKDGKMTAAGKAIVMGGLAIGVMQALALAAAGFGDNEPPEFERDKNLIMPIGNGKYVKLPMPLGYHVLPATGRILTEFALRGGRDPAKVMMHIGTLLMEAFNPVGGSGNLLQVASPTVADPVVDLTLNKDFTGRNIAMTDFREIDPTPGFTRAKDTASAFSMLASELLNQYSGGTNYVPGLISPTPDQIDYLAGQVFGGVGREVLKVDTTAKSIVNGEELPPYKIPLLGRFYGNAKSQASASGEFYQNMEIMYRHKREIEGRAKDGLLSQDYIAKYPEAKLYGQAVMTYNQIKGMRKQREQLMKQGDKEGIKNINAEMALIMSDLNSAIKKAKDQPND